MTDPFFEEIPFLMFHMANSHVYLLVLCLSCVSARSNLEFNQSTRISDIELLERSTRSIRSKVSQDNGEPISLVDFFASAMGSHYITKHATELQRQPKLERDYRRSQICQNLKHAGTLRALTSAEKRLRNCVCSESQPFLHCLAIGSQLLQLQGYTKDIEIEELPSRESLIPTDLLNTRKLSLQTLSNRNKGIEEAPCIPRAFQYHGQLCMGGNCAIPIAKILDIKIHDSVCSGNDGASYLSIHQCEICGTSGSTLHNDCTKVCKDNLEFVAQLVQLAKAKLTADICIDLGGVGVLFQMVFGGDNCFHRSNIELDYHKQVLTLNLSEGQSSLTVLSQLDYKYIDGPDCVCNLSTFRCTAFCKMKKGDVLGTLGISWNFFFASGTYKRTWRKRKECYTDMIFEADECENKTSV